MRTDKIIFMKTGLARGRRSQLPLMKARTLLLALLLAAVIPVAAVERWGVFELALDGPAAGNPYLDVQWSATFTQGDRQVTVPGFWDGDGVYRTRFSPPLPGEWRYKTRGNCPELDGRNGTFAVAEPAAGNHGPVQVFDTFSLRYADGTPYHQFGTTCYAWTHQTPELQEQTLQTLAASPFNKIRFCVFPKNYAYNKNEPAQFAFAKGVDGRFDFNRPNPAFWRHFEQRILDLQKRGIEADIILWHPYDRWGFADMDDEQDDRYLRHCIARLSAFRNVWWSLANEFDFMTERPKGHRGNKQWEDWDRFFKILEKEDPHQRLRGIHNGSKWYDHTKPWVTHASLQTSDMNAGIRFREKYRRPVIYDECKYEGNVPQGWGRLTAREMTQRFWLGTMSGCYVGHGETYLHPDDILWWAKGGVLHGESPKRIQWLKDLLAKAPPFHELQPMGDDKGRVLLGKPGEYYLLYSLNQRRQTIHLAGKQPYKVDALDPWAMSKWPIGTAGPGEFVFTAQQADLVYRFTPYRPGEKLLPPIPPPVVRERIPEDPIVRAGFADNERPALKYHGTASRAGDGAIQLPGGEPWGRVGVDDAAAEEVAGLRSFTIMAWLKPESLQTGSGGNRILYGLNKDRSGLDLVCHSDGRLRLSVNEWPDRVTNDSSPGQLIVGKWTFFAVAYDSTKGADNVAWYSSGPMDAPVVSPELKLDCRTTYNRGPVADDAGPLAIGNFNETMQGYGFDRQFRGLIRGLKIFGNHADGRAALPPDLLQELCQ